jgi:hypothetical protein
VCQGVGFPGSRAGDDEKGRTDSSGGADAMLNSSALLRIEPVQIGFLSSGLHESPPHGDNGLRVLERSQREIFGRGKEKPGVPGGADDPPND